MYFHSRITNVINGIHLHNGGERERERESIDLDWRQWRRLITQRPSTAKPNDIATQLPIQLLEEFFCFFYLFRLLRLLIYWYFIIRRILTAWFPNWSHSYWNTKRKGWHSLQRPTVWTFRRNLIISIVEFLPESYTDFTGLGISITSRFITVSPAWKKRFLIRFNKLKSFHSAIYQP